MASLNRVQIIGYLGSDPETRYMADGSAVTTLSVATSEKWRGDDGKVQEKTEWHRVTLWRHLAEVAAKHLAKGALVYVEGRISTRKWIDKAGTDRYTTEIVARTLQFLDRKRREGSATSTADTKEPRPVDGGGIADMDDDIVF